MEEPPETPSFAQCGFCGKPTLKDFLDEEHKCEYCREIGRRQGRAYFSRKQKADDDNDI